MWKDVKLSFNYQLEYAFPRTTWERGKDDREAIEAFLTTPVDSAQLQELKTASSLVEAPNVNNKPKIEDLVNMFEKITDIKERNKQILKAIEEGYSQHRIAKVLGVSQPAVNAVIRRSRK